jgi:hypothetical protein
MAGSRTASAIIWLQHGMHAMLALGIGQGLVDKDPRVQSKLTLQLLLPLPALLCPVRCDSNRYERMQVSPTSFLFMFYGHYDHNTAAISSVAAILQ